jgi:hypothetical protein
MKYLKTFESLFNKFEDLPEESLKTELKEIIDLWCSNGEHHEGNAFEIIITNLQKKYPSSSYYIDQIAYYIASISNNNSELEQTDNDDEIEQLERMIQIDENHIKEILDKL